MDKKINIGMIGCGFMGRVHSNAYCKINKFFTIGHKPVLKVVCDNNEDKVKKFADNWGWENSETDWRKVIARDDVDLIDICTPNNTHYDIVMAAAKAGKIIVCEKPLAMNAQEAKVMTEVVEKTGKPNMVWFNYRRVPAITLAKQLVEQGPLGRIFHYRAKYLQDWTISPGLRKAAMPCGDWTGKHRQRSYRRFAVTLDRFGLVAKWTHIFGFCHDRDIY